MFLSAMALLGQSSYSWPSITRLGYVELTKMQNLLECKNKNKKENEKQSEKKNENSFWFSFLFLLSFCFSFFFLFLFSFSSLFFFIFVFFFLFSFDFHFVVNLFLYFLFLNFTMTPPGRLNKFFTKADRNKELSPAIFLTAFETILIMVSLQSVLKSIPYYI